TGCAALGHLRVVDIRERGVLLAGHVGGADERGAQQRQPHIRLEPLAVTQPTGSARGAVPAGIALRAGQLAPACASAKTKPNLRAPSASGGDCPAIMTWSEARRRLP